MGGDRRPETKTAANGLLLCGSGVTGCHGWVEGNRDEAYELGLLLRRHQIPINEPVTLQCGRVLLDHEGNYVPISNQEAS